MGSSHISLLWLRKTWTDCEKMLMCQKRQNKCFIEKRNTLFNFMIWFRCAFTLLTPLYKCSKWIQILIKFILNKITSIKWKFTFPKPQSLPSAAGAIQMHAEWLDFVRQYKLTQKLSMCSFLINGIYLTIISKNKLIK